jgi:hypothetical protein
MGVIDVEIRHGTTTGTFIVKVVRSPAGDASQTTRMVTLDVDGLLGRLGQVQQAVLASSLGGGRQLVGAGQPVRGAPSAPGAEDVVRGVGQHLFAGLLGRGGVTGTYRAGVYRADVGTAGAGGEGLRIVLRIDDPVLACLPWEAMHEPGRGADGFVCRRTPLVRCVPVERVPPPPVVDWPVRILAIAPSPRGMPLLDVDREKTLLSMR